MGKSKKNLESDLQHFVQISLMSNVTLTPLTHVNIIIADTSAIPSEPSPFHPKAQFSLLWKKINIVLLTVSSSVFLVKQIPSKYKNASSLFYDKSCGLPQAWAKNSLYTLVSSPRHIDSLSKYVVSWTKPCNSCHFLSAKSQFIKKQLERKFLHEH